MAMVVERIYEDDQMVIFIVEFFLFDNFLAKGSLCLRKPNPT